MIDLRSKWTLYDVWPDDEALLDKLHPSPTEGIVYFILETPHNQRPEMFVFVKGRWLNLDLEITWPSRTARTSTT